MRGDIEQRARELLAAELRAANERRLAGMAEIPGGLDQIATHIALRAIVAALASQPQAPAAAVPDGFVVVPREPTADMLRAGAPHNQAPYGLARDTWAAMLAAAPAPEVSGG